MTYFIYLNFLCRVGGPIFFANAAKFVDQLYGTVLRPTDIKQPPVMCIVVSDDQQEFSGDSQTATTRDDVEMSELRCTNGAADELGDVQSGTTSSKAREAPDVNDNTEENAADGCGDVHSRTSTGKALEAPDLNDNTEASAAPVPQSAADSVRAIVLDFSRVTFVDSTAAVALKKVYAAYRKVGVQVIFSGCDASVTAVMYTAGLPGDTDAQLELYPTVHDAVMAVS